MNENINEFEKHFPLVLEIARKCLAFDIEPLSVEDAPKKFQEDLNRMLKKMFSDKSSAELSTNEAGDLVCKFKNIKNGEI